jgi:hypothetical protein
MFFNDAASPVRVKILKFISSEYLSNVINQKFIVTLNFQTAVVDVLFIAYLTTLVQLKRLFNFDIC